MVICKTEKKMSSIPVYNACCTDLVSFQVVFFVIKIFNQKILV